MKYICLFVLFIPTLLLAKTETLNLLVWKTYAPQKQQDNFIDYIKKKYNVDLKINVKYALTPHDFFNHVRAQTIDIFSPTHNLINDQRFNFIENNLIEPVNKEIVTNLKFLHPKFANNNYIKKNNILYGIPFSHGPYSLLYDSSKFSTPPTSWKIILDTNLRIKISQDHNEANLYLIAMALGKSPQKLASNETYSVANFKKAVDSLKKKTAYWSGVPTIKDFMETDLITSWGFAHPNNNPKWKFAKTKEGITSWIDYLVIAKNEKRSQLKAKICQEWLNYALSKQFQQQVVINKIQSLTPRADIKMNYSQSDLNFYYKNLILWPTLTTRMRNYLKKIWEQTKPLTSDHEKTFRRYGYL